MGNIFEKSIFCPPKEEPYVGPTTKLAGQLFVLVRSGKSNDEVDTKICGAKILNALFSRGATSCRQSEVSYGMHREKRKPHNGPRPPPPAHTYDVREATNGGNPLHVREEGGVGGGGHNEGPRTPDLTQVPPKSGPARTSACLGKPL